MRRKIRALIIIIFTIILFTNAELTNNPSIRLLASVINFSESTLLSPDYLAYGIDLKDLFRNYTNSDISYSGNAYLKKVKGFPYSVSGSISGQRSIDQKKFSCKSDLSVLVLKVGEMDFYAQDDTIYLVAPMLGDVSYGFDTDENLFHKAPDLNNDINREWFHNNKKNIWEFVQNIEISKTNKIYIDEDGTESYEYQIVIPQGQGDFIWQLLGMKEPDHDIKFSLYLDRLNHTRKMVIDLSYKTEGAYLAFYGNNCNSLELYSPLPDGESVVATIKRNGKNNYTNAYTNNISYTTENGDVLSVDSVGFLNHTDEGFKLELSDIVVSKNKTVLAEGYVKTRIKSESDMGDVFENAGVDLSGVEVVDWSKIKNDTASFVDDVISQARKNVDVLDLFT